MYAIIQCNIYVYLCSQIHTHLGKRSQIDVLKLQFRDKR